MRADAFDELDGLITSRTFTAPTSGVIGAGHVELIVFGDTSGIFKLNITVYNTLDLDDKRRGYGVDELKFTPVPEPSTLTLAALGLIGCAARWRRRRPISLRRATRSGERQ